MIPGNVFFTLISSWWVSWELIVHAHPTLYLSFLEAIFFSYILFCNIFWGIRTNCSSASICEFVDFCWFGWLTRVYSLRDQGFSLSQKLKLASSSVSENGVSCLVVLFMVEFVLSVLDLYTVWFQVNYVNGSAVSKGLFLLSLNLYPYSDMWTMKGE